LDVPLFGQCDHSYHRTLSAINAGYIFSSWFDHHTYIPLLSDYILSKMVTTSGFASSPVTRALIFTLLSTTLLTSILDIKHLLPIKPTPHLWPYLQFSRILTFQLAYLSSTELLFGVVLLYQFRVLERLWGSRKYGSFVVVSWVVCGVLTPALGVVTKIASLGWWGYIPPGVTGLVFSILGVWRAEVPALYAVKVVTGVGGHGGGNEQDEQDAERVDETGLVLSDKATTYVLAAQLALSQFPYQLLPAFVGWLVGIAWREELLSMSMIRWRIPGWMVGEDGSAKRSRGQYEGLRRRLEEEGGTRDGMREVSDGVVEGQRQQTQEGGGLGRTIRGYFTGS
jgi:membrane associated rhomboid family serine protease